MLNHKLNRQLKLMLCTCIMSYVQFIIGCTMIFSSNLLANLREPTTTIHIDTEDASWIASIPLLVCPIGLLILGILADKIGRKRSLQIAYLPIIISWIIIAYADSVITIITGRIVVGLSMGSALPTFLYLGEVSPTKYRPLCFSMVSVFVGVGMLSECVFAMFYCWQTVSVIMFALSTAGLASLSLVPESPVWLRAQGSVRRSEDAEKWLGTSVPATAAVTVVTTVTTVTTATAAVDGGDADPPFWTTVTRPTVWKPVLITVTFFVCQQGSGFYVLLFYSADVLRDTGVPWDGIQATAFLSLARVLGSLVFSALHYVDRRTMVIASGAGMAASLAVVVAYVRWYKDVPEPPHAAVLVAAFVLYVFFTLLAMLPLPWSLSNEVFPISVRGTMSGIVQAFNYELMFLVIKIYPSLVTRFEIEDVWSIFAAFCVASALFGAFIMPETKGKSLNEIVSEFESPKKSIKISLP